jgi:hypothetical protein
MNKGNPLDEGLAEELQKLGFVFLEPLMNGTHAQPFQYGDVYSRNADTSHPAYRLSITMQEISEVTGKGRAICICSIPTETKYYDYTEGYINRDRVIPWIMASLRIPTDSKPL